MSKTSSTDLFGAAAIACGVLSFLGWMVCAFGSFVGLGLFGLGMTVIFGVLAVVFGIVGHFTREEDEPASPLGIVGAILGGINLLLVAAYCAFSMGLMAVVLALFGIAIIADV